MKIKKKFNLLIILSILILSSLVMHASYKFIKNEKNLQNIEQSIIDECLYNENTDYPEKTCNSIIENGITKYDFFWMLYAVTVEPLNPIMIIIILFLTIPSLYYVSKLLKNRYIINSSSRENYKSFVKKMLKEAYKPVIILPITILLGFIICYIHTGTLNIDYSLKAGSTLWKIENIKQPLLFLTLYMTNIIIHSILYINIGLIIVRKYHNFYISNILSFLTLFGLEAILEIIFGTFIFNYIFKIDIWIIVNIMNMFTFNDYHGLGLNMITPTIMMILSCILVYYLYKNKENLIIDCERND